MLRQIKAGIRHIHRGTLIERLYEERDAIVRKWRGYGDREVEPGIRMRLYEDCKLAALIARGDYEVNERQFLRAYLRRGDVCVDVGANIGLFTVIAAAQVGPSGEVYSFEPCQGTYQRLLENVALNGGRNVRAQHAALSNKIERRCMTISKEGWDAWNSLGHPTAGKTFGSEDVACTTFDAFAQEHGLAGRVALMKIDVEGWENHVLEGARQTLSRRDAPDLLVEFSDKTADTAGSSCAHLYATIEQLGYRLFAFDAAKSDIADEPLRAAYEYANLIASKSRERLTNRLRRSCS